MPIDTFDFTQEDNRALEEVTPGITVIIRSLFQLVFGDKLRKVDVARTTKLHIIVPSIEGEVRFRKCDGYEVGGGSHGCRLYPITRERTGEIEQSFTRQEERKREAIHTRELENYYLTVIRILKGDSPQQCHRKGCNRDAEILMYDRTRDLFEYYCKEHIITHPKIDV